MADQITAQQLRVRFLNAPRFWHDDIIGAAHSISGFSGAHQGTDQTREVLAASSDQSLQAFEKDSDELVLYFSDLSSAEMAAEVLNASFSGLDIALEPIETRDWNAKWKSEFTGIDLPPYWRISPPWNLEERQNLKTIVINPSMGFGTGTHPTTQLCLQSIGEFENLNQKNILDFGSGSGILSVACALKGAKVWAVEIDEQACESARETFQLNKVESKVSLFQNLNEINFSSFDMIIANIISSVLEDYVLKLVELSHSKTQFVLSGILEDQVESVKIIYEDAILKRHGLKREGQVVRSGDWMRIVFKL